MYGQNSSAAAAAAGVPALAYTGVNTATWIIGAVTLIMVGFALVALTRRKGTHAP